MQVPIMPNTGAPVVINLGGGGAPYGHHGGANTGDDVDICIINPPPTSCPLPAVPSNSFSSILEDFMSLFLSILGNQNEGDGNNGGNGGGNSNSNSNGNGDGGNSNGGNGNSGSSSSTGVPATAGVPANVVPEGNLTFEDVRGGLHSTFGGPNGVVNYIKQATGTTSEYLKPEDIRLATDMEKDPVKKAYLEFFYGNFGDIDKKKGQVRGGNGMDGLIGAGDIQEYFGWKGGSGQTK